MPKIGLLVRIEAKPEYADQVESALRGAQQLVGQEPGTVTWFAFRQSDTVFGEIAQTMLASAPVIGEVDLLGVEVR